MWKTVDSSWGKTNWILLGTSLVNFCSDRAHLLCPHLDLDQCGTKPAEGCKAIMQDSSGFTLAHDKNVQLSSQTLSRHYTPPNFQNIWHPCTSIERANSILEITYCHDREPEATGKRIQSTIPWYTLSQYCWQVSPLHVVIAGLWGVYTYNLDTISVPSTSLIDKWEPSPSTLSFRHKIPLCTNPYSMQFAEGCSHHFSFNV